MVHGCKRVAELPEPSGFGACYGWLAPGTEVSPHSTVPGTGEASLHSTAPGRFGPGMVEACWPSTVRRQPVSPGCWCSIQYCAGSRCPNSRRERTVLAQVSAGSWSSSDYPSCRSWMRRTTSWAWRPARMKTKRKRIYCDFSSSTRRPSAARSKRTAACRGQTL